MATTAPPIDSSRPALSPNKGDMAAGGSRSAAAALPPAAVPDSPPLVSPSALPPVNDARIEVSMIEAGDFTGVSFTPELWMQRRHWALEVLRDAGVRSVLDIGCGPGSLLQTLVVPPTTITERPITAPDGTVPDGKELFIKRLGGVDLNAGVMTSAMATLEPPEQAASATCSPMPVPPRWEPMEAELWLGNIELYNSRLEGYDAIVALELIEHLEPNLLSRFGVVTMGTYRPKLLLVSTPNFDFNSKFPDHDGHDCNKRGYADPTGRTDRVFRHSDHKCEMTSDEFRNWAVSAAADWGYDVEIGGVGISSKPSYYPAKDGQPARPVYATQTAVFRLASGVPMRSPRSVRTVDLPFMLGASESAHPHRLAARYLHYRTATVAPGAPLPAAQVVDAVKRAFTLGGTQTMSLTELWSMPDIAAACAGSKRYLVAALGGFGDCPASHNESGCEVFQDKNGLAVRRL